MKTKNVNCGFTVTALHIFHFVFISVSSLEVKIGVIDSAGGIKARGPAVTEAIKDFSGNSFFKEHNVSISVTWRAASSGKEGIWNGVELLDDHKVDILLGPVSSTMMIPVSYFMTYRNRACISSATTSPDLGDKVTHNTFIRVNAAYNKFANAIYDVLNYFNWKRVVMAIDESSPLCLFGAEAMMTKFKENDITIAEYIRMDRYIDQNRELIAGYLERIKQRGRIVILCDGASGRREFLYQAHRMGMTGPEWVYIYYTLLPGNDETIPWIHGENVTEAEMEFRKAAHYSLKQISLADVTGPRIDRFLSTLNYKLVEQPWNFTEKVANSTSVNPYSLFTYDATTLYLLLLNETLSEGLDYRDGSLLFQKARNKTFIGMTGTVMIDDKGDRDPDYWMWSFGPGQEQYEPFMKILLTKPPGQQRIRDNLDAAPYWGTSDNKPPSDIPACGLSNEFCPEDTTKRNAAIGAGVAVAVIIILVSYFGHVYYRKKRLESELQQMLWKVRFEDVLTMKKRVNSVLGSMRSMMSQVSGRTGSRSSCEERTKAHESQLYTEVGTYKGMLVAIKKLKKERVILSRDDLLELKVMREISHENLTVFIGACVDPPNLCILTQYCPKGSLQMREISHENLTVFIGACVDPPNLCILTQYCPKGSLQVILGRTEERPKFSLPCHFLWLNTDQPID